MIPLSDAVVRVSFRRISRQDIPRISQYQKSNTDSEALRDASYSNGNRQDFVPGRSQSHETFSQQPGSIRKHSFLVAHVRQRRIAAMLLSVSERFFIVNFFCVFHFDIKTSLRGRQSERCPRKALQSNLYVLNNGIPGLRLVSF